MLTLMFSALFNTQRDLFQGENIHPLRGIIFSNFEYKNELAGKAA
jgi:hypothetical protein